MPRLLLTLRYDGTRYHGWQVQPNGVTVQQVMQDAVERLTGVRSGLTGCSRTDAGVHANMFCCTLDTACPLRGDKLAAALNAHLPADVAVYGCREVPRISIPGICRGQAVCLPYLERPRTQSLLAGLRSASAAPAGRAPHGRGRRGLLRHA